jgi:L-lactate dehydrogenase complex protein LldG
MLDRIRAALGADVGVPDVPRAYGHDLPGDVVDLFCERVADYLATVTRVAADELEDALAERCDGRVIRAPGVEWPASATDSADIPAAELDGYDAALTGCALAIAETGTIVLDGGPASGRRALTLVPDHHLCVVKASQIVASVPDAITALADAAHGGRPITFVSGPSATSDIELERVEGVHGPRKLDVFVVTA